MIAVQVAVADHNHRCVRGLKSVSVGIKDESSSSRQGRRLPYLQYSSSNPIEDQRDNTGEEVKADYASGADNECLLYYVEVVICDRFSFTVVS